MNRSNGGPSAARAGLRRKALPALLALAALSTSAVASAAVEVGLGYVDTIDDASSEAATLAWVTDEKFPWEFLAGHVADRHELGRYAESSTFVAASRRFTWRGFFLSAGLAYTDQRNEILSSHHQFFTGGGWAGERWSISVRHLSNADTGGRNRGETFALVTYRF